MVPGELSSDLLDCSELSANEGPNEAIEKVLHKYELEIRAHVKMEAEFKAIAQDSERRYEELRNEYSGMSSKYESAIQQLSALACENEGIAKENEELRSLFAEVTNAELNATGGKIKKKATKSIDKNKAVLHYNPANYIKCNYESKKVG